jgi:hypothetical protein
LVNHRFLEKENERRRREKGAGVSFLTEAHPIVTPPVAEDRVVMKPKDFIVRPAAERNFPGIKCSSRAKCSRNKTQQQSEKLRKSNEEERL